MTDANSRKLILIVDDFKDTREMYAQYLTQQGLTVAAAGDGAAAFSQALQLQPDLILMDLSLPDMSGSDVVSRLKANAKTLHIPVMALTAYGPEYMAGAVAEVGFSGYLAKTTSLDELLVKVWNALGVTHPNGNGISGASMLPPAGLSKLDPRQAIDGAGTGIDRGRLVLIADDFSDDLEMYA